MNCLRVVLMDFILFKCQCSTSIDLNQVIFLVCIVFFPMLYFRLTMPSANDDYRMVLFGAGGDISRHSLRENLRSTCLQGWARLA